MKNSCSEMVEDFKHINFTLKSQAEETLNLLDGVKERFKKCNNHEYFNLLDEEKELNRKISCYQKSLSYLNNVLSVFK